MKNSSDTALHRIIVAMIAAAESDLVACRLNRNVKGDQQRDINEIGDVPAADEGGSFLDAVCGIPSSGVIIAYQVTPPLPRFRAAHSVLLISSGAAIADIDNLNLLNPSRRAKLDNVALTCLHQCSRYRRYPTHLATIEIGLVNANDGDRSLRSPPMSVGYGCAEEYLIQVFLLCQVDHLSDLQSLGKKSYSPVNLAQTAFTVNVIAIF
jgi:hypothetical protein